MGICGSASADDKVGTTHTVGSTSPSDVNVDVNDNDETVVYADTMRLVSTQLLRRLTAAVTGDSAYDQLAVMSSGKDVTGFHLVAADAWGAYYRAVWDTKAADASADAKGDPATRFGALLNAVESGAAYKKPGASLASASASLQLLTAALAAQNGLLEGAATHAEGDAEFKPHKEQLAVFIKVFGIFDGGLKLLDNIERLTNA